MIHSLTLIRLGCLLKAVTPIRTPQMSRLLPRKSLPVMTSNSDPEMSRTIRVTNILAHCSLRHSQMITSGFRSSIPLTFPPETKTFPNHLPDGGMSGIHVEEMAEIKNNNKPSVSQ